MSEKCNLYLSGPLVGFCNLPAVKFYRNVPAGWYESRCVKHTYEDSRRTDIDPGGFLGMIQEISVEEFVAWKVMES